MQIGRQPGFSRGHTWWSEQVAIAILLTMAFAAIVLTLFTLTMVILHVTGLVQLDSARWWLLATTSAGSTTSLPAIYTKILRAPPMAPPAPSGESREIERSVA